MVRVNEIDKHLVADIVVGYYNRQNFRESQLLADRHSVRNKSRSSAAPQGLHHNMPGSGSGSSNNSDPEDDVDSPPPLAEPDGRCLPPSIDDNDRELAPSLQLRMPAMAQGGDSGILTLSLAEQRKERRRERRQAHQDRLRQQEAERESERRRMQADKERREREVARAVREAEDAERVRLLREAQEAENAAPVAARLMRTMQRKAAGAVAAAKLRVGGGTGSIVVDAGGGSTHQAVMTDAPADVYAPRHELRGKNHQLTDIASDGDNPPSGRRPSQVTFDKEELPGERPGDDRLEQRRRRNDGIVGGGGGGGGNLGRIPMPPDKRVRKGKSPTDREAGAAPTNDKKNRRQRPKKAAKAKADPPREGKDDTKPGAKTLPLSRAREKAAAAASAHDTVGGREGGKLTADTIVISAPSTAETRQQVRAEGADADLPRRKPSQERVGETRAVFVHRSSLVPSSVEGAAAGEAGEQTTGSVARAEAEAEVTRQRKKSTKGRVGSVLPT